MEGDAPFNLYLWGQKAHPKIRFLSPTQEVSPRGAEDSLGAEPHVPVAIPVTQPGQLGCSGQWLHTHPRSQTTLAVPPSR